MPEIMRYEYGARFYHEVESFLLTNEAVHNIHLGVLEAMLKSPDQYVDRQPYLAAVRQDGEVVGVAIQLPPFKLDLSLFSIGEDVLEAALMGLAEDFHSAGREMTGIHAVPHIGAAFAAVWQQKTGQRLALEMKQRVFKLERVIAPQGIPGHMRRMTHDDFETLVEWRLAFVNETFGGGDREAARKDAEWVLSLAEEGRGSHAWEVEGELVSMANATGQTPNGMRINSVYTPPEHRRRGYASAVTAALSQYVLDSGRQYCFLFTDLGNPTSNHIYQEIGYEPVSDVDLYEVVSD